MEEGIGKATSTSTCLTRSLYVFVDLSDNHEVNFLNDSHEGKCLDAQGEDGLPFLRTTKVDDDQ